MTHKTIEQQVEELALKHTNLNVLRDSEYYPLTLEDINKALQERDRIAREEERERIRDLFDRYSETYHWHKEKCMGHTHSVDCPSVLFRREALTTHNQAL